MDNEKAEEIKHINNYGKEMFNLAIDCAIDIVLDVLESRISDGGESLEEVISKLKELKK